MRISRVLRSLLLLATALLTCSGVNAQTAEKDASYELVTPQIQGHGAAVKPQGTAEMPQANSKVVFDITKQKDNDENQPFVALEKVARLINLYAAAGIKPEQIQVAVALHGDATKAVLNDAAYAKYHAQTKNPSLDLIHRLTENGVKVYVCLQALVHRNYRKEEVSEFVQIAAGAVTVIVNKQLKGYAYLPLHK